MDTMHPDRAQADEFGPGKPPRAAYRAPRLRALDAGDDTALMPGASADGLLADFGLAAS